jgi:urate oxidase
MPVTITENNYGKARVRLVKVARSGDFHELQNLTVRVAFEGEFTDVHTVGDNSAVLPTDTMKNTVYALAQEVAEIEEIEVFARRLGTHFLSNNAHVSKAIISIDQIEWRRVAPGGKEHDHSFIKGGNEVRNTAVSSTKESVSVQSGIEDLILLKTTRSGFAGFIRDPYTTLPETGDRIFCTSVKATWKYADPESATAEAWRNARETIIETFAAHDSLSVQHTLYAMGDAVLKNQSAIEEISFSLPNIHCLPIDFARMGLENRNTVFVPTDEPHGLIEATLRRQ